MEFQTTRLFDKDYDALSENIKEQADKKLTLMLQNPHHPSLKLKKIRGYPDIWEGRISRSYRFTFQIYGNTYLLRRIGTHDILRRP